MQFFDQDEKFWITVAAATVFKILTSTKVSITSVILTVVSAVFAAWLFTDPVLAFLDLDPEDYRYPVAGLLALTGEGAMRWLIEITPDKMIAMFLKAKK